MYEPTPLLLGILVLAGIAAGFVNTMAGGGSLMTLPVLMLLGLPANIANGTNRIAVFVQSVAGASAFARSGKLERKDITPVLAPTALGALVGASVAARVPEAVLKPVLLGAMVLMALVMVLRPSAIGAQDDSPPRSAAHPGSLAGLFVAGLYGGFIQAGVGFILLAVLGGVMRLELVRANALKLVCTGVFGLVALIVFVLADQVVWIPGLVLAAANVVGSLLGVRVAVKVPQRVIRGVMLVGVLCACLAAALKN